MNLLGIDFEDWYHPQLVEPFVPEDKKIPTMFKGLDKILELLRKYDVKATFFVVGELLESNPEILDKILDSEHEIGFHTMKHTRLDSPNFKEKFKDEIKEFDKLTSKKSIGFRAPTFSINKKSVKIRIKTLTLPLSQLPESTKCVNSRGSFCVHSDLPSIR